MRGPVQHWEIPRSGANAAQTGICRRGPGPGPNTSRTRRPGVVQTTEALQRAPEQSPEPGRPGRKAHAISATVEVPPEASDHPRPPLLATLKPQHCSQSWEVEEASQNDMADSLTSRTSTYCSMLQR